MRFLKFFRKKSKPIEGWLNPREAAFLEAHAQNRRCLEIGSYKGKSSACIAAKAAQLVCIDPFLKWDSGTKWRKDETNEVLNQFLSNTSKYNNIVVIKGFSHEVSSLFGDGIFDMIFIDGAHDYDNVFRDIGEYYPKLKSMGYYCCTITSTGIPV